MRRVFLVAVALVGTACGEAAVPASPTDASPDAGCGGAISNAAPPRVVDIAAGDSGSCAVYSDGIVWCWGDNTWGQLGTSNPVGDPTPGTVEGIPCVQQVTLGAEHTCALQSSGAVWCWGRNIFGQLGDGTRSNANRPVHVEALEPAVAIDARGFMTCALLADGRARCWGTNDDGELGDGTKEDRDTPTPLLGVSDAIAVAAGRKHGCALRPGGEISCWGSNTQGQLGDPSLAKDVPVPTPIDTVQNAQALSLDFRASCALHVDATVSCWGENSWGKLGDGTLENRPTPALVQGLTSVAQVDMGIAHACARLHDGTLSCWGFNGLGCDILGNGIGAEMQLSPVPALPEIGDAIDLALGFAHTCALRANGAVVCWGMNDGAVLGPPGEPIGCDGAVTMVLRPVDGM